MNKLFDLNNPFFSFLSKVADIIILSFLWFVCCIPIVTIGPATSALYYVTLKLARKEDVQITSCFFKGVKDNFKQGLAYSFIFVILGAVLVWLLQGLAQRNLPVIGDFLAQIVDLVQHRTE